MSSQFHSHHHHLSLEGSGSQQQGHQQNTVGKSTPPTCSQSMDTKVISFPKFSINSKQNIYNIPHSFPSLQASNQEQQHLQYLPWPHNHNHGMPPFLMSCYFMFAQSCHTHDSWAFASCTFSNLLLYSSPFCFQYSLVLLNPFV